MEKSQISTELFHTYEILCWSPPSVLHNSHGHGQQCSSPIDRMTRTVTGIQGANIKLPQSPSLESLNGGPIKVPPEPNCRIISVNYRLNPKMRAPLTSIHLVTRGAGWPPFQPPCLLNGHDPTHSRADCPSDTNLIIFSVYVHRTISIASSFRWPGQAKPG